jgi:two-component system response regulator NreC
VIPFFKLVGVAKSTPKGHRNPISGVVARLCLEYADEWGGRMIRIVIVEDHPLVLEAVKQLFKDHARLSVVGAARSGEIAVDMVRNLRPDLVILDISLPDINGFNLCPLFLEIVPEIRVIFFSVHEDVAYIHRALSCGAYGYVLKSDPSDSLVTAVEQVSEGKYWLSPAVDQAVVDGFWGGECDSGQAEEKREGAPLASELSCREFQLLRLILDGLSNKRIAHLLCLSPKTVEKHRANIMEKANSHTPMDLFRYAVKNKIVD